MSSPHFPNNVASSFCESWSHSLSSMPPTQITFHFAFCLDAHPFPPWFLSFLFSSVLTLVTFFNFLLLTCHVCLPLCDHSALFSSSFLPMTHLRTSSSSRVVPWSRWSRVDESGQTHPFALVTLHVQQLTCMHIDLCELLGNLLLFLCVLPVFANQ